MQRKLLILLFLILVTLPILIPYFNPRFFYTQDYIFVARLHQISVALSSGQFPVRWAPDLRFGEPIFNFYAPLPYYIGALIKFLGVDILTVSKILFILSSILSAITMYIFCSKLFGQKGAILGTILYTYAPYRAVDMYVRGSLSETWAFIFFPLIFYTSFILSEKKSLKRILYLALSLAGLFLTHNVTTLMFLPFLVFWWLYLILRNRNWKLLTPFLLATTLAVGLAGFFILPALFERQFIQTKYLIVGYFNFRAHFVAFSQLFQTFWGYGSSVWGPGDGLSFQVGAINWVIIGLSVLFGIFFRKDKKFLTLLLFLGIAFILSLFLQHNKSAFIWESIPIMAFIQFPWRYLAISIFIVSIAGASLTPYLKNKLSKVYFLLIFAVIISTFSYFKPKEYADDSFFNKFLDVFSMQNGVDLTKDYLPIWVENPDARYFSIPKTDTGKITVNDIKRESNYFNAHIKALEQSVIEVPITYFPGWEVSANDKLINLLSPSKQGLIRFELPKGDYEIKVRLKDTPIRLLGNIVSLVSIVLVTLLFLYKKKIKLT